MVCIFSVLLFIYLIFANIFGAKYWLQETGFSGKYLWDWLNLAILPISLSSVLYFLQSSEKKKDRAIEEEKQRETDFREYTRYITSLIKDINLDNYEDCNSIHAIANLETSTIISKLDNKRLGFLISFLSSSGLIQKRMNDYTLISINNIDLSSLSLNPFVFQTCYLNSCKFSNSNLELFQFQNSTLFNLDFSNAIINFSDFSNSKIIGTKFVNSKLAGAIFSNSEIKSSNFSNSLLLQSEFKNCKFNGVNFTNACLDQTNFQNVRYTNNTIWPEGFDPIAAGAIIVDS